MNVVTTRMLDSVVLGPVRHCIQFLDWQGIHVGAHGHGRTGTVSFKKPDNASMRDTGLNRKTETLQMLCHNARRAEFPVTELWMLVQVTANLHKLRLKRCGKMLNLANRSVEISHVNTVQVAVLGQ